MLIKEFLENKVEVSMGSKITKKELYKSYVKYCNELLHYPAWHNRFGIEVYAKFNRVTPKRTCDPKNGNIRIWRNIRLIK